MPSPQTQPPGRRRLVEYLEDHKARHDLTWQEVADAGPIPLQTLRRVRVESSPLSRDTRERLEAILGWAPGSVQAVEGGREPRPRLKRRMAVDDHLLNTAIGQVAYKVIQDLDADNTLTEEAREDLEATIAARIRSDAELFIKAKRAEQEDG